MTPKQQDAYDRAQVMLAFARGDRVQRESAPFDWVDDATPSWHPRVNWRVNPNPNPDPAVGQIWLGDEGVNCVVAAVRKENCWVIWDDLCTSFLGTDFLMDHCTYIGTNSKLIESIKNMAEGLDQ